MNERLVERLCSRASTYGITLREEQARRMIGYAALLEHWNRRINLTALPLAGLPDEAMDRLLLEPAVAVQAIDFEVGDWIDVGSGSGSPAVPMKLLRPESRLTMVESRSRKAAFLREVVRQLELRDAEVSERRLEDLAEEKLALADLVTSRGVRLDLCVTEAIYKLLRPGGRLFVFGSKVPSEFTMFERVGSLPLPAQSAGLTIVQKPTR